MTAASSQLTPLAPEAYRRQGLAQGTGWGALILAGIAALYLLAPPLTPAAPHVVASLLGAALLAVLWIVARRQRGDAWLRPLTCAAALVVVGYALSFPALTGDPNQSVVLVIVLLGAATQAPSLRCTAFSCALGLSGWTALAWDWPRDEVLHWAVNLGVASAVALAITRVRLRLLTELIQESRQARQANQALAEQARELRDRSRDLTSARDAALESARARSNFLSRMGHEVRTPLNGVLGAAQLLELGPLSAEQRSFVDTILTSGDRLRELVDAALDVTQADVDQLELADAELDLPRLLGVLELQLGARLAPGVDLRVEVSEAVPARILGDERRLRQVLQQLLSNALSFTRQGRVLVQAGVEGDALQLVVSDSGPGIPPEARARVFEPFFQVDPSSTREHGGAGLGLTVARRLVDLMGGSLELESPPEGGTRAVVRLPLRPAPGQPARERARVLLVEDNRVNRLVARKMLELLECHVGEACDGVEALERLAEGPWDLVLLDCEMPRMDGYEVARRLRQDEEPSGRRTPVLALTAHAEESDRARCLAAGMDDYLAKPVQLERLREVVARWVGRVAAPS